MRAARAAVTFVFFAHGVLFGSWVARIPAVKGDLDLSDAELGIALLGTTLGALAGLPLAGWIVSREGSRATVVQGLPVFALLLPALALAPNLALLFLALVAFGLAAGAVDVAMNAHGLAVEQLAARAILSTLHAGWSFGGLVGAGFGALLAAADVDPMLHFAGVAVLVGLAGLAATRRLLPASADRPQERARMGRPPGRLLTLALLAFCGLFAEGAAADWSAVYIDGPVGASAAVAALGFAAFSVMMATFRLLGDRLTTRWGPDILTRGGGLLAAGGLALALVVQQPAAALVGFACMGAGLAAIVPISFRAAGSLPGIPAAVGIAALTSVGYAAFLVGPPVIGFTAEAVGLTAALWIVVALLGGVVALAPAARMR